MSPARPILINLPNQFAGERVLARRYTDEDAAALHATIAVVPAARTINNTASRVVILPTELSFLG